MVFRFQQALRAVILLIFSIMLFRMHLTGELTKYINPKFELLSLSAAILFLVLFVVQLTRVWAEKEHMHHNHCQHDDCCGHDHGSSSFNGKKVVSYLIITLPLITGFLLPANILDASMAAQKGGMAVIVKSQSSETEAIDEETEQHEPMPSTEIEEENNLETSQEDLTIDDNPIDPNLLTEKYEVSEEEYDQMVNQLNQNETIIMDDFVYNVFYEEISMDIDKYAGRKIELNGFVYKEEGFTDNQLVISRFMITHCVADASIVGFLSEFDEASELSENTWLKATGVLDVTTYNGAKLPIIKITDWEKTEQPETPYIYPISIRIL